MDLNQRDILEKIATFSRKLIEGVERPMVVTYHGKTHPPEEAEKMSNVGVPTSFATSLPSYIIMDIAIKQFIPLSLQ